MTMPSSVLYNGAMTTTTEDLVVVTERYIEQADELVKLAERRIADSREEVDNLITDLQERLDDEDLPMTGRERSMLSLTIGVLEDRANALWRLSRV